MNTHARSLVLLMISTTFGLILGCEPAVDDGGGRKETGPATVAATGDPWGEMPTEVNPFYFTDFDQWVGKPLADQELARLINRPIPEALQTRTRLRDVLPVRLRTLPPPARAVVHRIGPRTRPSRCSSTTPIRRTRWRSPARSSNEKPCPADPTTSSQTPALFAVKDGVVTGFASDPDDVASVDACIASNAQ